MKLVLNIFADAIKYDELTHRMRGGLKSRDGCPWTGRDTDTNRRMPASREADMGER